MVNARPLNEEIRPRGWIRFFIIFLPVIAVRFASGTPIFSFYWFVLLYFPIVLWLTYWFFGLIRLGLNHLAGEERYPIQTQRKMYIWYLNVPGSLALSELIYQGYLFHQAD